MVINVNDFGHVALPIILRWQKKGSAKKIGNVNVGHVDWIIFIFTRLTVDKLLKIVC